MGCLFRDCFAIVKNSGREAEGVRGNFGERSSEEFVVNTLEKRFRRTNKQIIRLYRAGYVAVFYSEYFLRLETKTTEMDMFYNCTIR